MNLRNVRNRQPSDTASHPTWRQSSATSQWNFETRTSSQFRSLKTSTTTQSPCFVSRTYPNDVQQSRAGVAITCACSHHQVTRKFTELSPRQQMQDCSQLHGLAILISEKENDMSIEQAGGWDPDPTASFDTKVAWLCWDRTSPQPGYCTDCTISGSTSEAKMHFMFSTYMLYIIYLLTFLLTYSLTLLTYVLQGAESFLRS